MKDNQKKESTTGTGNIYNNYIMIDLELEANQNLKAIKIVIIIKSISIQKEIVHLKIVHDFYSFLF